MRGIRLLHLLNLKQLLFDECGFITVLFDHRGMFIRDSVVVHRKSYFVDDIQSFLVCVKKFKPVQGRGKPECRSRFYG